ncbi:MAG: DUF3874 domain-containing protein [Defluviitaleaceae bacterium]|nr:DUF3874 domain-containing protein [Defluviitaleaceae bacterium]
MAEDGDLVWKYMTVSELKKAHASLLRNYSVTQLSKALTKAGIPEMKSVRVKFNGGSEKIMTRRPLPVASYTGNTEKITFPTCKSPFSKEVDVGSVSESKCLTGKPPHTNSYTQPSLSTT